MLTKRNLLYQSRRLLRLVGRAAGSSHAVALGISIGFLIGWLPFIGTQTPIALLLCHIFRANRVVTLIPVWLTNPVTFVPVSTVNYWVGWKLAGGPPLSDIVAVFKKMVAVPVGGTGEGWLASWWNGIWSGIGDLLAMGWEMLLPFCLGSLIVGLTLAVVFYFLTRKFVDSFREAMQKKKHQNRERRRRDRIERNAAISTADAPSIPRRAPEAVEPGDAPAERETETGGSATPAPAEKTPEPAAASPVLQRNSA